MMAVSLDLPKLAVAFKPVFVISYTISLHTSVTLVPFK